MSLPFRILSVQTGTLCLACALGLGAALFGIGAATLVGAGSMLLGGLSIVLPSAAYAWVSRTEHRPNRLLLFAGLKVVATLLLLTLAVAWAQATVGWLLAGMVIAYLAHMGGALWLTNKTNYAARQRA